MPSLFAPKGSSQGYSALQNDVSIKRAQGSSGSTRFGASPGRASVNITKPETIGQSIEGLGQGILGLVGSVPLVGGLLKGTLETVGGAVGAVGTAVGSIRPVESGPSVGDVVSAIPGAAMDVISAPSKFVQREVISEFTAQQLLSNDKSGVQDYYDIPQIKTMVQSGATVDEIADVIYEQGRTFGAKPDIVRDVALGLLTDPLTWIPGGAIASGAAKAGGLAKAVKAGVILGAKESEFMKLWQPVGQVYNAISGTLSGSAKAFGSIVAGRTYNMLEMAFKTKNIQNATRVLAKVSPGEEDVVLATASELTSVTIGRTAKAGAAALIEDQASLSISGSLADMQDTLLGLAKTSLDNVADTDPAVREKIVSDALSDLLDVASITKESQRSKIIRLVYAQVNPKAYSSVDMLQAQRELEDFLRGTLQKRALGIDSAKAAEDALATQGRLHGKSVTEAGARILIGGKQELIALVDQPEAARTFVRNALGYALGRSEAQADQFFDEVILPAINSRNVEDAIEYLEFVRMPAYGKLARDLANLRQTQTGIGSRVTLISQRTLSRARAADLLDTLTFAKSNDAAKEAVKLGVSQYDELFATFGKISIDDLDDAGLKNLREDMIKYLDENSNAFAVDIQADEIMELSEEIRAFWPRAEAVGYRLGIAPEDGLIKKWSTLQDKYGRYYQTKSFAPYADLVDTAFTNPQNLGSDLLTYKRNPLQSMVQYALSPRYGSLITAKATNRFVTETSSIGMNAQESRAVWQALNDLANEAQTLPRGLALEQKLGRTSSLAKKINGTLTKEARARISAATGVDEADVWNEVFMSMMRAYAGRVDDIGLMPAFTSWIKMKMPSVAIVTDRLYPFARFGELAPQFRYIQENIEPNFFRFTTGSGVREQRIAGLTKNDLRTRAIMGEFAAIREVGDAQTVFMVAGNHVAGRMAQKVPTFWDSIGKFARGEAKLGEVFLSAKQGVLAVEDRKRRAMQAIISRGAALRAYRVMAEEMPEVLPNLRKFFGTDDPEEIMQIIGLDFIARTDPVAAQRLIDEGIDLTMVRQFTDRGYEPTQVAINAKKFREAGGELEEVADPEDLKQFLDDVDNADELADEAYSAAGQEAFKEEGKALEDLFKYGADNYNKAILKRAVKEKVSIAEARNIVMNTFRLRKQEAVSTAIKKLGENPTKKAIADVEAKVLKDFGEVKEGTSRSFGFDGAWWDLQAAGFDQEKLMSKHLSNIIDAAESKASGPKPLSSYERTALGVVRAMEDYSGGSKVITKDMLKTPKDFAIAKRMYTDEISWDEAAKRLEKDRVEGLAEELPGWNAVKDDPKLRKQYLERNNNPEEWLSADPDSRFYISESNFVETLEPSNMTNYPLFDEDDIDDFFDAMDFDIKKNQGWQKFPDESAAYIKKVKESRDAGSALAVLKDALNRYFMWEPKVQKSARWIVSRDADGNISGFALTVSEKLRAGLGDDVADKLTVTHLGSFTRGQGTGSALLADAHRASKAAGIEFYVLDPTDASKAFYKKLGFEIVDSQPFTMGYAKPPEEFLHTRVGAPDAEVESYRNVVSAFRKAAADEGERARRAIYFDPNRPWWERSLNHPLIALYPLSYMVGKVIPEFTRLLIATPFAKRLGGTRPFLGAEALRLTADATVAAIQYDPDFRDALADNPELWIAVNWLLPYTPDNIGFGLSSTVRKLGVAKGMAGEGFDISRFPQEAFNQVTSAALPGTIRMAGAAVEDLTGDVQLPSLEGAPDILDILQGKN